MGITATNVSLAGEYAVLSQLFLRGFIANVTLGNAKGVDILVFNPVTRKMIRIEVKTRNSGKNKPYEKREFGRVEGEWQVSESSESLTDENLFYCFVNASNETHSFEFYIVPSSVVAENLIGRRRYKESKGQKKNGKWRWFRFGNKQNTYPSKTPPSDEYREPWDLLQKGRLRACTPGMNRRQGL
jgi:hypothetical protein